MKYRAYVYVWIALVVLTGGTVTVGALQLGFLSVLIALLIAAVKSGLVLNYFMHLRDEKGLFFKLIIPGVLAVLALFIGLTFTDVAFR